jgi:hypothetical protein
MDKLEIVKKQIENLDVNCQMRWNKKLPDLEPTNPPIPNDCLRNFRGQAPTWEFLERLLLLLLILLAFSMYCFVFFDGRNYGVFQYTASSSSGAPYIHACFPLLASSSSTPYTIDDHVF